MTEPNRTTTTLAGRLREEGLRYNGQRDLPVLVRSLTSEIPLKISLALYNNDNHD